MTKKSFLFLVVSFLIAGGSFTGNAFAESVYRATEYSCGQLQGFLSQAPEGKIRVLYRLGRYGGIHYAQRRNTCGPFHRALSGNVRSASGMCQVGWKCWKKTGEQMSRAKRHHCRNASKASCRRMIREWDRRHR